MVLVTVIQAELEGRHSQAGAWERETRCMVTVKEELHKKSFQNQ